MANSKMQLELLLKGRDQLSAIIKKQSPLLKQLDRDALKAYNSLKKLFDLKSKGNFGNFSKGFTSESGKIISEVAKLKKAIKSIGNIKTPKINTPSYTNAPQSSDKGRNRRNIKSEEVELDGLTGKKKNRSYAQRLANFNERVLEPATQVKDIWKGQISSLQDYTEETKKLYLAQAKFKLINLSPEENKKAFEAVNEVVRKFGTVTRTEGIETLTDLHTAMGNLDHAIEALPNASKYRFSMKTLFADKFSNDEVETQIQSLYKFLEVTGKVAKGQEEMNAGFNAITQLTNATGGRVTPSEMLLMARRGGSSLRELSPEGLRNLSAPIQELGGSGTGVAMMTMRQALVGGVMKESAANRFHDLGLLDESKIEYNKAGKIKRLLPGANKLGDPMMSDPKSAADMLREAMKKHGINTDSQKDVSKELAILFQNRTAQNLMDILINQPGQVAKEADLAKNAQGSDKMFEGMDENLKKIKMVENAWVDVKIKAGIPLIQTFGKLAETTTPILQFFGEHEKVTQWALAAMLAGKGIKLVSETASILSGTGNGIASFFNRGKSSADNATLSFRGASAELGGVSNKLSALKGGNIPIGFKVGAIIGLEYAIQKTVEGYLAAMEAKKGAQDSIVKNTAAYNRTVNDPEVSAEDKAKIIKLQAADVFGKLNNDNDLLQKFGLNKASGMESYTDSMKGTWWIPGMRGEGYGKRQSFGAEDAVIPYFSLPFKFMQSQLGKNYSVDTAAQKFRDDAPTLKNADVMREFLKFLPERIKGQDAESVHARNEIGKIAQTAFPDSYKQASQQMAIEQGKLAEQSGQLGQSFLNVQSPMPSLIEQFTGLNNNSSQAVTGVNSLATATGNAANRINSIQFTPPTFAPIRIPVFGQAPAPTFGGNIFGRAKGGSVTSGHSYRINEVGQEFFTPNQSGSIVANDALRKGGRGSRAANQTINFNPTVNVNSDNPNADKILSDVRRELAIMKREFQQDFTPDRLAQKVEFAAQRDSERT